MPPLFLLAFTASLIVPLIAACLTPVCVPSTEGYQVGELNKLFKNFCGDLSKDDFAADREVYGPITSLSFRPATGADLCDQSNCLSAFGTLIQPCAMNSHSIWDIGSIDVGCGTYNFTVWNNTLNPVGTAMNIIGVTSATGLPMLLNLTPNTQTSNPLPIGKSTATKPSVGNAALGTSDAGIIQGSGYTLIAVAFIFTWFL